MKIKWVVLCIGWGKFFFSQLIQNRICSEMLFLRQAYHRSKVFRRNYRRHQPFVRQILRVRSQLISRFVRSRYSRDRNRRRLRLRDLRKAGKFIKFNFLRILKFQFGIKKAHCILAFRKKTSIGPECLVKECAVSWGESFIWSDKLGRRNAKHPFENLFQWHTIWKLTSKLSILRTSSKCIRYFMSNNIQDNNSFELMIRLSANHGFKFWKFSAGKRSRRTLKSFVSMITITSHLRSNETSFQINFFPDNFW